MAENVHELRSRAADSEKITINLGFVDLGQIELLVQEGFYSNRTDFIRTAIRNQIERHAEAVRQSVTRRSVDLGLRRITRAELEAARAQWLPSLFVGAGWVRHDGQVQDVVGRVFTTSKSTAFVGATAAAGSAPRPRTWRAGSATSAPSSPRRSCG